MDNKPAILKFAVVGHQDSWDKVMQFIQTMRLQADNNLTIEKVQEIFTYIPPRKIFDIEVNAVNGSPIQGAYIETFIAPDELDIKYLRKNIDKVKKACALCAALNIPVVSLGGFSSIVLEVGGQSFRKISNTYFTTGNTLTAAFISKAIEKACVCWKQPLSESRLLIIGSTGDIGSACVLYFQDKVKELLLCARQAGPLQKQSQQLNKKGIVNTTSISLKELIDKADIIISVASSIIDEENLKAVNVRTIICDAGYPKNLQNKFLKNHERFFYGGMGIVTKGFEFENNSEQVFYKFPLLNIGHGCLLEAVVLALENKSCSYSYGKGNITLKAMKDMLAMANKHGIKTAPIFNKVLIDETATEKI